MSSGSYRVREPARCGDVAFERELVEKEDGRYLVLYSFGEDAGETEDE